VAEQWKDRGFSLGIFTDPPGQVWKDYVHGTDELLMAAEGEMELEMKGEAIRCKIGEEILIPAKTVHTVRNIGKTGTVWYYGYKQR
jgi:mannose-6-phosphate isomerase-like protein (cupin superfamily)